MTDYLEIARAALATPLAILPDGAQTAPKVKPAPCPASAGEIAEPMQPKPSQNTKMAEPGSDEFAWANRVFSEAGVRLMEVDGAPTIGIWSDRDSPKLRTAIRMFHPEGMPPVRYLDGLGIPPQFKLRSVPGDSVPSSVLEVMEANPEAPWEVRDRMLASLRTFSHTEWRAEQLNRIFSEQGVEPRQPGRIAAAAAQDALDKEARQPSCRVMILDPEHKNVFDPPADSPESFSKEPAKPQFGQQAPVKVTHRTKGQAATFGPYEWIYNTRAHRRHSAADRGSDGERRRTDPSHSVE